VTLMMDDLALFPDSRHSDWQIFKRIDADDDILRYIHLALSALLQLIQNIFSIN
jgi:hypothetical protein